jgi:CopG family transcriptional regulator, nickel-responsive regulator
MAMHINELIICASMAKIISMSLNADLLAETDRLQKEHGFSGRSEVIRAGLRMLIADSREKGSLSGRLNSVLLVIHSQNVEDAVTSIKHRFEDIITTQVHSHMKEDKCLEIFTLDGDAGRIKEILAAFQVKRKMDYVKLVVA